MLARGTVICPFLVEHVGNAAGRGKVAIIFGEDAANLRGCAVLVVCRGFHDHSHAARRITLVDDFVEMVRLVSFAGARV